MNGYTDLAVTYDQYSIDRIEMRISWSPKYVLSVSPNNPGQSTYPLLYYFKDYDDSSSPTSLSSMKERGNLRQKRINPNGIIKIHLKPAVLTEVKQTGTSASRPSWNNILDMGSPDVQHYGLKIGVDHLIQQDQGQLDIEVVYHVTCFGTR